jgi:hypothetical protein
MKVKIISEYGRGVDTEVVRFHRNETELVVEYENGSEERYQHGKAIAAAGDTERLPEPEVEASR